MPAADAADRLQENVAQRCVTSRSAAAFEPSAPGGAACDSGWQAAAAAVTVVSLTRLRRRALRRPASVQRPRPSRRSRRFKLPCSEPEGRVATWTRTRRTVLAGSGPGSAVRWEARNPRIAGGPASRRGNSSRFRVRRELGCPRSSSQGCQLAPGQGRGLSGVATARRAAMRSKHRDSDYAAARRRLGLRLRRPGPGPRRPSQRHSRSGPGGSTVSTPSGACSAAPSRAGGR
jgi:hypothetical protein